MPVMQLFHQVQHVLLKTLELEGLCNGLSVGSGDGRLIRGGRRRKKEKENILIENMQSKITPCPTSFIHLLIENGRLVNPKCT